MNTSTRPAGPIFGIVDGVLRDSSEYRAFREGRLSRHEFGSFLERKRSELIDAGLPANDVSFAKRFPSSIAQFVDRTLEDLVESGAIPHARYDRDRFDLLYREASSFEHGGLSTYIYPEEARTLFAVADILSPKRAVFLGSYYGYWAYWTMRTIAERGGHAVLIDPNPEHQRIAELNIAKLGLRGSIEVAVETGENYLDRRSDSYDFVVLDAEGPNDHPDPGQRGKRVYGSLLEHVLPQLEPGARLVCHNILFSDHSEDPFFRGVIAKNEEDLGPFMRTVAENFTSFREYRSTEGLGVGRLR